MLRLVVVLLIALVAISFPLTASANAADSTFSRSVEFRSFGRLIVPIDTAKSWRWYSNRFGALFTASPSLDGYADYGVSNNKLYFAYVRLHGPVRLPLGDAEASLEVGQYLSPVSRLYPSSPGLQTTRWLAAYDPYLPTGIMKGVCATAKWSNVTAVVGSHGARQYSGTLGWQGLSIFAEQDIGCGLVAAMPGVRRWINLSAAYSSTTSSRYENSAHIEEFIQALSWLRVYGMAEWVEHSGDNGWYASGGLTASHRQYKNCFAKLFWDGHAQAPVAEITYFLSLNLYE